MVSSRNTLGVEERRALRRARIGEVGLKLHLKNRLIRWREERTSKFSEGKKIEIYCTHLVF